MRAIGILVCSITLLISPLRSKAFHIELYGQVLEHFSSDPLKAVFVRVYIGGTQKFFKKTTANGKFRFRIEREEEYIIEFTMEHMVSKRLLINTKNIPAQSEIPFYEMELEMDLFPYVEGIDYEVLDQALGKAYYDKNRKNMVWDSAYKKNYGAKYAKFWWHYERAFYGKTVKSPKKPKKWPPTRK